MRPKRLRRTALALLALAVGTLGCVSINLPGTMPEPLMETTVRGVGDAKILLLSIDGVGTFDHVSRSRIFAELWARRFAKTRSKCS